MRAAVGGATMGINKSETYLEDSEYADEWKWLSDEGDAFYITPVNLFISFQLWRIFWPEMLIYAPARKIADSLILPVFCGIFCVSSSYRHFSTSKNWWKWQKNARFWKILFEKELFLLSFSKL